MIWVLPTFVVLGTSVYAMFGTSVFRLLREGFVEEPFHVLGAVLLVVGLLVLPFLTKRGQYVSDKQNWTCEGEEGCSGTRED